MATLKVAGYVATVCVLHNPMSSEVQQQAQAEKLTLRVSAKSKTGYYGVRLHKPNQRKPYQARVSRGNKLVHLG